MELIDLKLVEEADYLTVLVSNTWKKRMKGIRQLTKDDQKGILLYPCNWIHSFTLKLPLDIYFFSNEGIILQTFFNIMPRRFLIGKDNTRFVIEVYSINNKIKSWQEGWHLNEESLDALAKIKS